MLNFAFLKKIILILIIGISFLVIEISYPKNSYAAKPGGLFGTQETIRHLVDVELTGENGETLFLGRKITFTFFVLGVYVKDNGYVLGVRGKNDAYYNLPSNELIENYKSLDLLPKQFPDFTMSFTDYLWGFSAWIVLGVIGVFKLGKSLSKE